MEYYICVLNPASGDGLVERAWPVMQADLEAAGLDCRPVVFTGADLLPDLEAALNGDVCRTVVGIGGDGTHNAVFNALMKLADRRGEVPLPYLPLPFGTGNDIAKSLRIPSGRRQFPRVIDLARQDRSAPFDLGRWEDLYFADAVCVGLDAEILARRGRYQKWLEQHPLLLRVAGGYILYTLATLAILPSLPRWQGRIEVDGKLLYDGPLRNVVVNNTAVHAGEFEVTPGACHDDGQLDVGVFTTFGAYICSYLRGFRHAPAVFRRGLAGRRHQARGRHVSIALDRSSPVQVDGEIFGHETTLELSIVPQAARVRAPAPTTE